MAGDTHYIEHYVERYPVEKGTRTMYHFVNGGGGAYLSIGTPLDWPDRPAVPDCAFFPRTDAVIAKLDRDTPGWKVPLWQWVKHFRAWPATAETLAGAFDYGRAPFFQSFVEVRVEGSANRVRLIPHGANGPLRWRDLQTFGAIVPDGKTGDDLMEVLVPMPPRFRVTERHREGREQPTLRPDLLISRRNDVASICRYRADFGVGRHLRNGSVRSRSGSASRRLR